ncbi:sulfotransferase 1C2-like [Limulus polyphemus]|uniref:Sulfotransferase 1C2-like n=1 Tax=Limulus polyphemus TaxID=6850 RepID=A0ABM1C3K7_LIMPO|nr:sulfotransferase 1C2-like [Limulus polyphemus]
MDPVTKTPAIQEVDGFFIPKMFSPDAFRDTLKYRPRDDDVFIVTYPKCGTTWVQHIVMSIFKKGEPIANFLEFQRSTPFLEMTGPKAAEFMLRPGAIKTHLPFHLQPYSPKAKFIYVARNPKDCCVSFFHHMKMFPGYEFQDGCFDDFFELFINGFVDFGDYFDHLLSWYEHRNDPNVLFITYEEIKADTEASVMKMAGFLGKEYVTMLENDPSIMKNILYYTSIEYMKKNTNKHLADFLMAPPDLLLADPNLPDGLRYFITHVKNLNVPPPKESTFIRKGIVGDWKNYLSPEQSERLAKKFKEKTKGTDIPKLWPDMFH